MQGELEPVLYRNWGVLFLCVPYYVLPMNPLPLLPGLPWEPFSQNVEVDQGTISIEWVFAIEVKHFFFEKISKFQTLNSQGTVDRTHLADCNLKL